ncbi:hypothetical protein [Pseudomonas turukhanskensis]|uniref:Integral membrane protein n=1 Tax=Pseudomonas turukhanskensis TaxID=1806536 RepID=A0A9W6KBH7_9PSED|nr:hypothetical protein [Pseudomonas turukhanskensis]GLK91791.1 hypothetical protein GCM10017655_48550 [Pseudomonas turukhanskensis]
MTDSIVSNPYAVPASNLQALPDAAGVPTLEEALSRRYDFGISDLLGEAWTRTKGTKGIIIGGFVVFYAALFAVMNVLGILLTIFGVAGIAGMGLLGGADDGSLALGAMAAFFFGSMLVGFLATAMVYPFLAGINMVGIRAAAGQPVRFGEVFAHFGRTVPVIITALLMTLLVVVGYMLFVVPGIYLSVAYILAIPLVVERGLSPWQALEASRKAINQHWFKVFGLFLLLGVLMSLSMIPLGIGLLWTIPLMVVSLGVLYRTIFGVRPVATN